YLDACVHSQSFGGESGKNLRGASEVHAFTLQVVGKLVLVVLDAIVLDAARRNKVHQGIGGQVKATHDNVLTGRDDGLTVGRAEDVVGGHHEHGRFDLGLDGQRQVDGHLVAIEVGIESLADQRMDADGVAFDEHRFERL